MMSLPDIMQWAELNMKTGTLVVVSEDLSRIFFIQEGKIIFVSSQTEGARLGEFLSMSGYIGEARLQDAVSKSQKLGVQLTNYLVSERIIDKNELEEALILYAEASFTDILKWKDGEFEFSPILPPTIINGNLKINISYLMFQSVKTVDESGKDKTLDYKEIMTEVAARIKGGDIELPPVPDIIIRLNQYMQRDDASTQEVVKTVMADQILTSKILKVANSAYYAPPVKISTLHHAISYLGFKSIISIVTAYALTSINSKNPKEIKKILQHSLLCAFVAKRIATVLRLDPEELFLCGLLHDIGKTVLINLMSDYKLPDEVRLGLIQRCHGGAGYLLATKWNLSDSVRSTINHHHHPEKSESDRAAVETVFLANMLANDPKGLEALDYEFQAIDIAKLDFNGILSELESMQDTVMSII